MAADAVVAVVVVAAVVVAAVVVAAVVVAVVVADAADDAVVDCSSSAAWSYAGEQRAPPHQDSWPPRKDRALRAPSTDPAIYSNTQ